MARIRSIHPALFTDESFAALSMAARVLLFGLWTEADDQGVFDWKPITIKMRILPVDNVDVPQLLAELEQANIIRRFDQDEKPFGALRNFCKFQKPKTPKYRPLKSSEIRAYVASNYPLEETTQDQPDPFPQKGEMPPQREEGGGKREEIIVADGTDARAREPLVHKHAFELSDRLLVIAGHDPKFPPPGWCGAPMRVQSWLNQGWPSEIILVAVKATADRKTGPPAASVQFFEKAIAEEVARQAAPLPIVEIRQAEQLTVTRHGTSRNQSGGSLTASIRRELAELEQAEGADLALPTGNIRFLPN